MRLRSQLALSGGVGVAGGAALMGGALFLLQRVSLRPLVSGLGTWVLLSFLLFFSLVEIPMMILAMRHMMGSLSSRRLVNVTNAAFTFFAAVYAAPYLLLTGRVVMGIGLAGLSLVRFAGALWFIPGGRQVPPAWPPGSDKTYPTSHSEEL
jgi:hypothetical protein